MLSHTSVKREAPRLRHTFRLLTGIAVVVGGAVTVAVLVNSRIPAFDEVMAPCLSREASLAPAHRVATCLCIVDAEREFSTILLETIVPASLAASFVVAARNECRASYYERDKRP